MAHENVQIIKKNSMKQHVLVKKAYLHVFLLYKLQRVEISELL